MKNRTNGLRRTIHTYNRYVRKFNRLQRNGYKSWSSKKLTWLVKRIDKLHAHLTFLQEHAGKLSKAALLTSGIFFAPQIAKSQSFDIKSSHPFVQIVGDNSGSITFVDFDGDTDMDFFIWGSDAGESGFKYYENTGSEYITKSVTTIPSDFGFTELLDTSSFVDFYGSFTDFDADGDLDLFVGADEGEIRYLRNDDAVYVPVIGTGDPFDTISLPGNVKPNFGDLDGDGDIDAVVGSTDGVHIYMNNDGLFDQAESISSSGSLEEASTLLYDFDDDGDLDLLVGNKYDEFIYFTNNVGVFTQSELAYSGISYNGYSDLAIADVDFDGDTEFVMGNPDGAIDVFEEISDTELKYLAYNPLDIKVQGTYSSPVFVDFDGDGDDDMFLGLSSELLYYENTEGTYQLSDENPFNDLLDDFSYLKPKFEDYDGDGDLDLLVGEYESIQVFNMNDGAYEMITDTLQNPFHNITEVNHLAPAFYDADGDGDLDLILGNKDGDLEYFVNNNGIYEADAMSSFSSLNVSTYSDPVFVDLDSDGDKDLVVGLYSDIKFFINNDGSFTEVEEAPITGVTLVGNIAPGFTDINGDGSLDILMGSTLTNRILLFENTSGPVSVNTLADRTGLTEIFPNPATNTLALSTNWLEGDGNVYIFNSIGKIINRQKVNGITHQIDISDLAAGHYVLHVSDGKSRAVKSFVVTK